MTIAEPHHIAAARGVAIAARNLHDGRAYVDAIQIHTRGLSRDDLLAVIELLGGLLSLQFESTATMAEALAQHAAENIVRTGSGTAAG